MKHYLVPTFVALALVSPWGLAEETAQPSAPVPETAPPGRPLPPSYVDFMQKHREHRQEMQNYMQKRRDAKTPEERQQLDQEYEQLMQKHWEEMRALTEADAGPWGESEMPPPPPMPPYGYGPRFGYGGYPGYYGPSWSRQPPVSIQQRLQNIEKLLEEIKDALPSKK